MLFWSSRSGLSPLARGNPAADTTLPAAAAAYPRSRGGTKNQLLRAIAHKGLSPLARGNHRRGHLWLASLGPIPARAGEPEPCLSHDDFARAYPRSRGGTDNSTSQKRLPKGLSPLARGNLEDKSTSLADLGPIPARAGEPPHPQVSHCKSRAYPRSRGGTYMERGKSRRAKGLSPLARGNPQPDVSASLLMGPIPARAGEPLCIYFRRRLAWAYPRSRGGTSRVFSMR